MHERSVHPSRIGACAPHPVPNHPRAGEAGFGLIDSLVSVVVISLSTVGFLAASVTSMSLERETRTVAAANELSQAVVEQMLAMPIAQVLPSYNANTADDPNGPATACGSTFQLLTADTAAAAQVATETASGLLDTTLGGLLGRSGGSNSGPGSSGSGGGSSSGKGSGQSMTTGQVAQSMQSMTDSTADVTAIPRVMNCRVQLPTILDVGGVETLREDANLPEFGLPADLNGDGVIDSKNHVADYKVLPVVIRLDWPDARGGTRSVTFATVIGGGKAP